MNPQPIQYLAIICAAPLIILYVYFSFRVIVRWLLWLIGPIRWIMKMIREQRHFLHEQERHHRHHIKRKALLEVNLAKGKSYHLSEDGEVVFDKGNKRESAAESHDSEP